MTSGDLTSGILFLIRSSLRSRQRRQQWARVRFAKQQYATKIRNRNGGIAQLVERQLCKLEVRGSNPLASKAESVEAKVYNPGTFSDALAGA